MSWETIDEKRVKTILKQIAGKLSEDDDELVPPVFIKGRGEIWCYAPTKRSFVKISRNTKATLWMKTQMKWGVGLYMQIMVIL